MKWLSFVIAFLCVSFGHALLTVPQNVRAAAIGPNGFTLRWDTVTGANSYEVEVFGTLDDYLVNTGFEGLSTFPDGWSCSKASVANAGEIQGMAHQGTYLGIIQNDGYVMLPKFDDTCLLRFWAKAANKNTNSSIRVELIRGESMELIKTLQSKTDESGELFTYYVSENIIPFNPEGLDNCQVKIRQFDGASIFHIDDVKLQKTSIVPGFGTTPTNAIRITGLDSESIYTYRIRGLAGTEQGQYSYPSYITTLSASSNTSSGSIINGSSVSIPLPTVGSFANQALQITPSTSGDSDYTVTVSEVDGGLSYAISCDSNAYLNGIYSISHPGYRSSSILVSSGNVTDISHSNGLTSFSIESFDSKGTLTVTLDLDTDTLPVEMGNMTVSYFGAHAVNLQWLSHSETNLLGYYVWRSETGNLQDARMISPLIQATNSSSSASYVFQDNHAVPRATYWIEAVEYSGGSSYHGPVIYQAPEQGSEAPEIQRTALESIYPNPFNPTTTISYWLKERQSVSLRIYDYRGRLVHSVNKVMQETGKHSYIWNAGDAASGVYLMKLQIGRESFVRKMVLLK